MSVQFLQARYEESQLPAEEKLNTLVIKYKGIALDSVFSRGTKYIEIAKIQAQNINKPAIVEAMFPVEKMYPSSNFKGIFSHLMQCSTKS